MHYIILTFMIFIINKCDAGSITDNPHIILTKFSSNTLEQAAYYTVLLNKPLFIHFRDMSISRGWCFNYYEHDKTLDTGLPPTVNNSTINFKNVTSIMSALWKCNVTEMKTGGSSRSIKDLKPKYLVFYLQVHVKGAKSVILSVNDKKISFSKADLSVPYDGAAVYFYEDGEYVQVVCRNPQRNCTVHLEYFTKDANNFSESATFDIQLHSGSNRSYIDCVCSTTKPADTYVYRLTFISNKPLFGFNESQTVKNISSNQDTDGGLSPLVLGGAIGAVLVVLAVTGAVCCFIGTRNAKRIETPYEDLSSQTDNSAPQQTNAIDNQHDLCHDCNHLSNKVTYYSTPNGVEDMDPKYHFYTEIDYLTCKPKTGETQNRNSLVYDEPYVQITMRAQIK